MILETDRGKSITNLHDIRLLIPSLHGKKRRCRHGSSTVLVGHVAYLVTLNKFQGRSHAALEGVCAFPFWRLGFVRPSSCRLNPPVAPEAL